VTTARRRRSGDGNVVVEWRGATGFSFFSENAHFLLCILQENVIIIFNNDSNKSNREHHYLQQLIVSIVDLT